MKWNIGIINNFEFKKLTKFEKVKKIIFKNENIDTNFGCADPFIYKDHIFCELIDKSLKGLEIDAITKKTHNGGILACSKLNKILEFKVILSNVKFHYSYPHIFEENHKIYMIPETHQSNKLFLYENIDFPYKWKQKIILLDNIFCYDCTIFKKNDIIYLFVPSFKIKRNKKIYTNSIYKSSDLLKDKFKIYQKNVLPNSYRGGGNTFIKNNKYYIPIQPKSKIYGEKLYIYQIIFEKDNIKFQFEYEIIKNKNISGIHNLSNYNNKFIIDYYE